MSLGNQFQPSFARNARGISLIEVMVSVLVLAIGLMGVAAMQALALRGGQGSLESSQAVMQATSIIEAMRANRANAAAYVYDGTSSCAAVPAAAGSLADFDKNAWVTSLKETIGSGTGDQTTCGKIESIGNDMYRIVVQWDDSRADKSAGSNKRQIITETRI